MSRKILYIVPCSQYILYFIFRYSYSKDSQPIDAEVHCSIYLGYNPYSYYWEKYGSLPLFIRRFEEVIYGRDSSFYEHCVKNTRQNVAIVHFHIASSENDLINKIVKTPRVTTADILSNIGTQLNLQFQLYICYIKISISILNISLLNLLKDIS